MSDFDVRMRERARTEDCPEPKNFEYFVRTQLEELPPRKRKWRGILRHGLIAAAVCVVLVGSVLAASPTLRDALSALLGGFEPYSQTVEGVAVADQGIEIRVVSTLADENGGTIYLTVTDLTGNRLEAGMGLDFKTPVSFDAETGTALFAVNINPRIVINSEEPFRTLENPYPLHFSTIYPTAQIEFEGVPLPWDRAGEEILESYTLEGGMEDRTVLKPGQTPMSLEGTDLFSISSMGWDDEGTFHILLEMAEGVDCSENGVTIAFDERMGESTDYYASFGSLQFIIDGGRYMDMTFPNAREYELEKIMPNTLYGYVRQGQPIRGSWDLEVPLELLPARTVAVQDALGREKLMLESLTFSVRGVQAQGSTWADGRGTLNNMPLTVYLADGTTRRAVPGTGGWSRVGEDAETGTMGRFQSEWSFEEPVDPQTIVGVALSQRYIPIDGDTAGEGSWLAEVP